MAVEYKVIDCSGYSSNYRPENIIESNPTDQASRWSSPTNDPNQFILLQLQTPALLTAITFGKFHKVHVCNLKEFIVWAGSSRNSLVKVVHSGLRNDAEPETFPLDYGSVRFASSFVKIVPIAAWGSNFNFSIWYIQLHGVTDPVQVEAVANAYSQHLLHLSWRVLLKFIRDQCGMNSLYDKVAASCPAALEDPLLTNLYRLILQGEYSQAEDLLMDPTLFEEYLGSNVPYEAHWTRIDCPGPSMRGGHQMVWDPVANRLYLLGGWDGTRDLGDFWMWEDVNGWTCLSMDTESQGGPSPRSCHKACIYDRTLYVLGRFIEQETRTSGDLPSELFAYHLDHHVWTCISNNVQLQGGPPLIYDHQMVVDDKDAAIYLFGGRIMDQTAYSGLYRYEIPTNSWTCIFSDDNVPPIKSRIGHSMVIDTDARLLYIYAGQRSKDYLADFHVYNIDTNMVVHSVKDTSRIGGPEAGFTQRATIDTKAQEIFLFSGLMATKATASAKNSLWMYSIPRRRWSRIYTNDNHDASYWRQMRDREPCPRYAHQLVLDPQSMIHYLFGGNPGETGQPRLRLSDFWSLALKRRLAATDILRKVRFLLRRQNFFELCHQRLSPSSTLLLFLQNHLSAVVNHADPEESTDFRRLSSWLFHQDTNHADINSLRLQLFEQIIQYLPASLCPPKQSLVDLLSLSFS